MSQVGNTTTFNGKKICFNHRKGRCRFGHNCKFAHDSDADIIASTSGVEKAPDKNFQPINTEAVPEQFRKRNPFSLDNVDWDSSTPVALQISASAKLSGHNNSNKEKKSADSSDEEGVDSTKPIGKRKRPGLARNLDPGKKVMNTYYKNKSQQ